MIAVGRVVILDLLEQLFVATSFNDVVILENEAELELKEFVRECIAHILVGRFLEHRLMLDHELIVFEQLLQVAADLGLQFVLYLSSGVHALRYKCEYGEIDAVFLAELLDEH